MAGTPSKDRNTVIGARLDHKLPRQKCTHPFLLLGKIGTQTVCIAVMGVSNLENQVGRQKLLGMILSHIALFFFSSQLSIQFREGGRERGGGGEGGRERERGGRLTCIPVIKLQVDKQ